MSILYRNAKFGIVVLTVIILVAWITDAASARARSPLYRYDEVLVKFKPGVPAAGVLASCNAETIKVIPRIDVHRVRIPKGASVAEAVSRLRKNPNVIFATPNYLVHADYIPDDTWFWWFQWAFYNLPTRCDVHGPEAWDISTGSSNIVIAIVDTGIDSTHPDLEGRLVPGYNVFDGSSNTEDDHFHGTFVAGIAAATGDNAEGIAGMNWGARLMPVKVLSAEGYGDEAGAAEGVVWAVDHGAKVINMSLGAYEDETNHEGLLALENAVNYAWNQGCLVVCAAGNDNLDDAVQPHYPSYYPAALCVGGTDDSDERWVEYDWETGEIAGGSNYGDSLDVMAPSYFILSAVPLWYADEVGTLLGDAYEFASGTSAAAPLVSGLAALIWGEHPTWSNQRVRQQIEYTCDNLGIAGWDRYTGWGRVNAYRALSEAYELYTDIGSLRNAPIGSLCAISAQPVTAGTLNFGDRFFLEAPDRSAGIMVYYGSNVTTPTAEGHMVEASGKLSVVDGQLALVNPRVSVVGTTDVVKPLYMTNRCVGGEATTYGGVTNGTGLVNTALLVTVCGRVTAVGWNYFYIDDGSHLEDGSGFIGLKVFSGSLSRPSVGRHVIVTGISTVEVPQSTTLKVPIVRPRKQSDIIVIN